MSDDMEFPIALRPIDMPRLKQAKSFPEWLDMELADRQMKPQDLAREADLDPATISNIRSGKPVGVEASRKIAKALDLPQWVVFYAAGLLTEPPDDIGRAMSPVRASINRELKKANERQLKLIYNMIRALSRFLGGEEDEPPAT